MNRILDALLVLLVSIVVVPACIKLHSQGNYIEVAILIAVTLIAILLIATGPDKRSTDKED